MNGFEYAILLIALLNAIGLIMFSVVIYVLVKVMNN